jgi:ABC-type polar amino acid transport system ATPase subunit
VTILPRAVSNTVNVLKQDQAPGAGPLIEVRELSKVYGRMTVLDKVEFQVQPGEVVCIIGRSGSGKSTLLRSLNLLAEPTNGSLTFKGELVGEWIANSTKPSGFAWRKKLCSHRERIGMVFQHFELFPHLSVMQNVALGPRRSLGVSKEEAHENAIQLLEQVGLKAFANARPGSLSGGQKQRVAIARALAMNPELLLLDEPTSALDPEMVRGILDLLVELAAGGMTMVSVTHELGFAAKVADRIVVVDSGKIVESGSPQEVMREPESEATRSLIENLTAYHAFG